MRGAGVWVLGEVLLDGEGSREGAGLTVQDGDAEDGGGMLQVDLLAQLHGHGDVLALLTRRDGDGEHEDRAAVGASPQCC